MKQNNTTIKHLNQNKMKAIREELREILNSYNLKLD
jgi:hypothetical protein